MGYNVTLSVDSNDVDDLIMAIEAYEGEDDLAFDVEPMTLPDGQTLDSEYVVEKR